MQLQQPSGQPDFQDKFQLEEGQNICSKRVHRHFEHYRE